MKEHTLAQTAKIIFGKHLTKEAAEFMTDCAHKVDGTYKGDVEKRTFDTDRKIFDALNIAAVLNQPTHATRKDGALYWRIQWGVHPTKKDVFRVVFYPPRRPKAEPHIVKSFTSEKERRNWLEEYEQSNHTGDHVFQHDELNTNTFSVEVWTAEQLAEKKLPTAHPNETACALEKEKTRIIMARHRAGEKTRSKYSEVHDIILDKARREDPGKSMKAHDLATHLAGKHFTYKTRIKTKSHPEGETVIKAHKGRSFPTIRRVLLDNGWN